jgi:hypothetical protein
VANLLFLTMTVVTPSVACEAVPKQHEFPTQTRTSQKTWHPVGRHEALLVEQIQYNLLFRWFVGLAIVDTVWNPSVFSKNR